jgi:hypothetical protein
MKGGERRAVAHVPIGEVTFVPFETIVAIRTSTFEWDVWHYEQATLVSGTKHGYIWDETEGICIGSAVELEIFGEPLAENFVRIPLKAPRNKRRKAVLRGMGSVAVSQHVSEEGWTIFELPVAHVEFSKHGGTKLLAICGPEMLQGDRLIEEPRIHFVHEWIQPQQT